MGMAQRWKFYIARFLPIGSFPVLVPFTVLVSIIMQVSRPITLVTRLRVNTLLGGLLRYLVCVGRFSYLICMILAVGVFVYECVVVFVQRLVFKALLGFYMEEIKEG